MSVIWLWLTLCLLGVVSAVHSIMGEHRLLKPMFRLRGNPVLDNPLARVVLRLAWHVTSVCWLVIAVLLYLVHTPITPATVPAFLITGVAFLAVGLTDLVASRGRHVGWPILALIGVFAIATALTL